MTTHPYELTRLGSSEFEHMVNSLAMQVLGPGHSTFGPGSDGGRDGLFEGEAPYPSGKNKWSGSWYIQSKFHAPNLSSNAQKWLVAQVEAEIAEFSRGGSRRLWPDNWIIATNIEPSGKPETGSFDRCRKLLVTANPNLAKRFHIWGGRKILDLLATHEAVARQYSDLITSGQVLASLKAALRIETLQRMKSFDIL